MFDKEEVKKCTHEGFYESSGSNIIPLSNGLFVVVTLICTNCGEALAKMMKLPIGTSSLVVPSKLS